MTEFEYSNELEELLESKMDSYDLLEAVLKAIGTEDKIDIFLYVARMHDIPVPERD